MKTSLVLMMVAAMCVGAAADEAKVVPAPKALPAGWVTPAQKEAEKKARELKAEQEQREHERMLANIDRQAAAAAAARAAEEARAQAVSTPVAPSSYYPPMNRETATAMSYIRPDTEASIRAKKEQEARDLQEEQARSLRKIANELELRRLQGR